METAEFKKIQDQKKIKFLSFFLRSRNKGYKGNDIRTSLKFIPRRKSTLRSLLHL